jgi:hypothetical protein
MPPRRSARVAAVAERESSALSPLPPALAIYVFSLLPADARARAACVCRGWRTTLEEPSLWTRLDLSPSSGVAVRETDAVLAGAAHKARGQLAALDVSELLFVTFDALLAVVRANGGALRELCVGVSAHNLPQSLNTDRVERLLQAAPHLAAFYAGVFGDDSVADARRMLRNEPPFQPLRVHALRVEFGDADTDEASVLLLAADIAAHASLTSVVLNNAPMTMPAALDAVVDAALARQIVSLSFRDCDLSPASAPALARLLGSGALTTLSVSQARQQFLGGPSAALLGAALRANATLTYLNLCAVLLWRDADAAAALLGALTGHSSLRTLSLSWNRVGAGQEAAAGAALGALVAANAPALTELDVSWNHLEDVALRSLLDALPGNTHLRTLNIFVNDMSGAFARDVLLPAVRANSSLRTLHAESGAMHPGAVEATALVAARRRDGGGGGAV